MPAPSTPPRLIAVAMLLLAAILGAAPMAAAAENFSGRWSLDLRTADQRARNLECGLATFELSQIGDKITGNHTFATPGCGQVNEGGYGTVTGVAIGPTAVLVVTSARNGAVVMGKATLSRHMLNWAVLEEIKNGEPEGESALILGGGLLSRTP